MIRAHRVNATAQDDASLVAGWNIAPNLPYILRLAPGASSCGVLLYDEDNMLVASGAALVGTEQPCVLLPQTGQTVGTVDADLGWHLLISTDGTESQREIRINPAVDLPDEIHPVYGDDDMGLARATAAIDEAAHYRDDVTATCPLGIGAGLGDVASVPVDGAAVVGQVESITWTATPDGTSEQAVIRRHVAIAPEPYVEPTPITPPTVADDTGATDAATTTSGNVLDNDDTGLTVVAVNGLSGQVGTVVAGSAGGLFTINSDGSWSFDPSGDFGEITEDTDTAVTYYASDGAAEAMATLTVTVSAAGGPTLQELILSSSPSIYWRVEETAGTIAADTSGNGNDGVYAASVILGQTGLAGGGNAAQISAADSIVGPQLVASTAISVVGFAKIDGAPSSNMELFGFTAVGYYAPWFLLVSPSTGYLRLLMQYQSSTSGRIDLTASVNVCDNLPHQIGFTWDKDGDKCARIYVDGQVVATSGAWDRTIWAGTTSHRVRLASNNPIIVDEFALYLSCLTTTQVAEQYAAR